jgi:hypothetical protein
VHIQCCCPVCSILFLPCSFHVGFWRAWRGWTGSYRQRSQLPLSHRAAAMTNLMLSHAAALTVECCCCPAAFTWPSGRGRSGWIGILLPCLRNEVTALILTWLHFLLCCPAAFTWHCGRGGAVGQAATSGGASCNDHTGHQAAAGAATAARGPGTGPRTVKLSRRTNRVRNGITLRSAA